VSDREDVWSQIGNPCSFVIAHCVDIKFDKNFEFFANYNSSSTSGYQAVLILLLRHVPKWLEEDRYFVPV
jgi:hypothetical protein